MPQIDVKKVIQELIVPELKDIKSDIRELRVEIKRLDEKIDSKHNEVMTEIRRLDEKIDIAIQIRERLTALEAKVAALLK